MDFSILGYVVGFLVFCWWMHNLGKRKLKREYDAWEQFQRTQNVQKKLIFLNNRMNRRPKIPMCYVNDTDGIIIKL